MIACILLTFLILFYFYLNVILGRLWWELTWGYGLVWDLKIWALVPRPWRQRMRILGSLVVLEGLKRLGGIGEKEETEKNGEG